MKKVAQPMTIEERKIYDRKRYELMRLKEGHIPKQPRKISIDEEIELEKEKLLAKKKIESYKSLEKQKKSALIIDDIEEVSLDDVVSEEEDDEDDEEEDDEEEEEEYDEEADEEAEEEVQYIPSVNYNSIYQFKKYMTIDDVTFKKMTDELEEKLENVDIKYLKYTCDSIKRKLRGVEFKYFKIIPIRKRVVSGILTQMEERDVFIKCSKKKIDNFIESYFA
jgi:hypothetical protein